MIAQNKILNIVKTTPSTKTTKIVKATPPRPRPLDFKSWAPEVINGRSAMVGLVASTMNHSLMTPSVESLAPVITTGAIIGATTLINGEPENPLADVEKNIGRIAMLVFTSGLVYNFLV